MVGAYPDAGAAPPPQRAKSSGAEQQHDGYRRGMALFRRKQKEPEPALFEAIRGCLGAFDVRPGAHAVKRHGRAEDPDAREERVPLA